MPAPRSPARDRLAAAIADLRRVEKESDDLALADEPSLHAIAVAEAAFDAARDEVHAADRGQIDHRVQTLAGAADAVDVLSIDDARRTLERAERELQVAREARAEIVRRTRANADALPRYRERIVTEAKAVVLDETAPLIGRLAHDLEDAQQKLVEAGIALTLLRRMHPHRYSDDDPDAFGHLRPVLFRLDQLPAQWDIAQPADASLVALRIRDWLDALTTNAAATMPT